MAMMKMVDMAMIRAVARCPWPESSAGGGERGQHRAQDSLQVPRRPAEAALQEDHGAYGRRRFHGTLRIPNACLASELNPTGSPWPSCQDCLGAPLAGLD